MYGDPFGRRLSENVLFYEGTSKTVATVKSL